MAMVAAAAWQGWVFLGMLIGLPAILANLLARK